MAALDAAEAAAVAQVASTAAAVVSPNSKKRPAQAHAEWDFTDDELAGEYGGGAAQEPPTPGDDDDEYRVRCPGGCDDPTSLAVLRPKPRFAGLSWPALVAASGGRVEEIAQRASR